MNDMSEDRWAHPAVILVATDLSELDRIMPVAIDQAVWTGARLVLLHVIPPMEAFNADDVGVPYYDPAGAMQVTEKDLAPWAEQAARRGVLCEIDVRTGNPAEQVLKAAWRFHADRIVVGTRSRGKISKLLIGSVAEEVLRETHVPVVTVGPEAHWKTDGGERVVLHATQLLEEAPAHAELAHHAAKVLGARLLLIHVAPAGKLTEEEPDKAVERKLNKLVETMSGAAAGSVTGTVVIEPRVVHGDVAETILAEAKAQKASLIVLGSTTRPPFQDWMRERTVYQVLAHAPCPVMTLVARTAGKK